MTRDAILLDLDGTLVDTTYFHGLAWQRALAAEGIEVESVRCHRAVGLGGDKVPAHLAGDEVEERLGDALRDGWKREYRKLLPEVRALPGAADAVRRLADDGWLLALATSGEEEFTDAALELLGIRELLDAIVSTADVEESKPAPDLLGEAMHRVRAERAVMVGDTTWDVEAAERAGIGCIGLLSGGFAEAELRDAGALEVVEGPVDLPGLDLRALLRTP